jgi:transcriptional regulator with XRE-family HTH domain
MTDPAVAVSDLLRRARNSAGMSQRELARAAETSQAAVARYETGRVLPDLRTLDRLLGACGQRLTVDAVPARRTGRESATTRPVATPDDIADAEESKAVGVVELPLHIRWSGPPRSYDLDKRRDRARVYEQVLREGTEDDVRHFVRLDDLLDVWDELVLPDHVRAAWDCWFATRAGAISC